MHEKYMHTNYCFSMLTNSFLTQMYLNFLTVKMADIFLDQAGFEKLLWTSFTVVLVLCIVFGAFFSKVNQLKFSRGSITGFVRRAQADNRGNPENTEIRPYVKPR